MRCDHCDRKLVHVESRSFLVGRDRGAFMDTEDHEVFRHAGCGECDEDGMVEFDSDGRAVRVVCDCQDECARRVWVDPSGDQLRGEPDWC